MKSEFEKYLNNNKLKIDLTDFTTIEKSFNHSLRFELGDGFENGTKERVQQAKERALKISNSCFEKDKELYVLTYEWDSEGDFLARTPDFLYQTLKVDKSREKRKLALMYFQNEKPEYEEGYLGVYILKKETVKWEDLIEGIANMDMGFNPSVHQNVYIFGTTSNKLFWMYDDRGCLIMTQNLIDLESDFNAHKNWLCEGYEEEYKEKIKAPNNV